MIVYLLAPLAGSAVFDDAQEHADGAYLPRLDLVVPRSSILAYRPTPTPQPAPEPTEPETPQAKRGRR
jgi:hypothetical protein